MNKLAVLYYSKTGNTEKMARAVEEGARNSDYEVETELAEIENFDPKKLLEYEGIIIGSPTYYGIMANPVKDFLDESIKIHGDLSGKLGAAFASCGTPGGGSETTCLSIIKAMLVHGMSVRGFHDFAHYGPVSTGSPNERVISECQKMGEIMAKMVSDR